MHSISNKEWESQQKHMKFLKERYYSMISAAQIHLKKWWVDGNKLSDPIYRSFEGQALGLGTALCIDDEETYKTIKGDLQQPMWI